MIEGVKVSKHPHINVGISRCPHTIESQHGIHWPLFCFCTASIAQAGRQAGTVRQAGMQAGTDIQEAGTDKQAD